MLFVLLAASICAIVRYWDYIPGTVRLDYMGHARGTGWSTNRYYKSGGPMGKAYYRAGELMETVWYKPDGSIVASSKFQHDGKNISYDLREDGSVAGKYEFKDFLRGGRHEYLADGPFTYFWPDGSVERIQEYREGQPVTLPPAKDQQAP